MPTPVFIVVMGVSGSGKTTLAEGIAGEEALYEEVLVSADRREGFKAFAEKRPPTFEGR